MESSEVDKDYEELVDELYMSFNCAYSKTECLKALIYNQYDIQNAAFWLVEECDKER